MVTTAASSRSVVPQDALFLPAHALEGFGVCLLVYEAAGFGIALYQGMILRVVGLGPFAHGADAMVITRGEDS